MGKKFEGFSVISYYRYSSLKTIDSPRRLGGPFRIAVFCLTTMLLPITLLIAPLVIRYQIFKNETYNLGESDLVTVDKRISTFWCEGQHLWMNATFHAYLLDTQPRISEDFQNFEMDKHMQLADDSLEYWGFFLLQGSKVILSVCSRYEGARLMVVKGTKNLKHCALLDPSPNPDQVDPWEEDVSAQVIKVTYQKGDHDLPHPDSKESFAERSSILANWNSPHNGSLKRKRPKKSRKYLNLVKKVAGDSKRQNSSSGSDTYGRSRRDVPEKDYQFEERSEADEEYEESEIESDMSLEVEEAPPEPVGAGSESIEFSQSEHHEDESIDEEDIRSSGSSFAKNLWSCYGGDTLFTQSFSASLKCQSQDALLKYALRMRTVHEITSTGYYYYIFYSDNDIVSNDIFARFNIEKVVYSFPNYTNSCVNVTKCSLPLNFLSSEKVLIEVPLQDGVSDEDALAQMVLVSTCRPRWAVYFLFPVAAFVVILYCSLS